MSSKERKAKKDKQRAARYRARLWEVKRESGCVDCGYNEHPVALQFDHLPEFEKVFTISQTPVSAERLEAELLKCEVVCANCHAVRTHERNDYYQP